MPSNVLRDIMWLLTNKE